MEQNKDFDAVKMMREIHEKLREKYLKHPEILKQEMQQIREKYHLNIPEFTTVKQQFCQHGVFPKSRDKQCKQGRTLLTSAVVRYQIQLGLDKHR